MSGYIFKPPPPPPPPPAPVLVPVDNSHRGRGGGGKGSNNGQRGRGRGRGGFNGRGGGGGGRGRGYIPSPVLPPAHYIPSLFPQLPNPYGLPGQQQQQQQFLTNPFHNLQSPLAPPTPPQLPQQQQQAPSYLSYSQEKTTPAPTQTSTSYTSAQSGWPVTPSYGHFTLPTPISQQPPPRPPPPASRARRDEKPDMDEETWLRLNGGKLIGTNLKPPETSEEIEEWIRERRKKFPTKERVAERAKQEEERKRKLAEAYATSPPPPAEVPANQKRKRPEQDNSPDSDSDSNSTPEELTTSKRPLPSSSPRKKANRGIPCRVFQSTGRCKYGNGCKFKHAPDDSKKKKGEKEKEKKGKSGGGVKSLYQQLLEQDREKENELVVRAVRYLFEKGLLNT